jgi:uncharacterized protein YdhG (YjbR/CyaY superfamily)
MASSRWFRQLLIAAVDVLHLRVTQEASNRAQFGALVVHGTGQLVDRAAVVPDAQQRFSYGLPGFKIDRKTIAGFAAFENHLS